MRTENFPDFKAVIMQKNCFFAIKKKKKKKKKVVNMSVISANIWLVKRILCVF